MSGQHRDSFALREESFHLDNPAIQSVWSLRKEFWVSISQILITQNRDVINQSVRITTLGKHLHFIKPRGY